ncbi:MAG: response regulator, partial [Verrucomicrobiota bacterium]
PFRKRNLAGSAPPTPSPAVTQVPSLADGQSPAGCAKKILVVDDDAVILKTTSSKLKSQGYQVVTAMDAAEAMNAVRQKQARPYPA